MEFVEICQKAKEAAFILASAGAKKDEALTLMSEQLLADAPYILSQNAIDLENARAKGIHDAMLDRLTLNDARLAAIAHSIRKVRALADPLGAGTVNTRPNGLQIQKVRVPIGVIGIIYEARPNVTADAAALCVKSGNAVILRGGSEAIRSNLAIGKSLQTALKQAGLPTHAVQVLEDTSRETANKLMTMNGYIDLLIPRGGKGLIQSVVQQATVPVIETGAGNCHVYVDQFANLSMALDIIDNAKTQRPSVCNAAENLLVHQDIAKDFLPMVKDRLCGKGVELRGCEKALAVIPGMTAATEQDFYTEYNDYILSIKVVASVEQAVSHINQHGTKHSEAIVTESMAHAAYFTQNVDAAAVYVNASTRFTDGEEFGFGAEIGISTQKLHVRGPMGLEALTTTKYMIQGTGQIRG